MSNNTTPLSAYHCALFADRPSLEEALAYATRIAQASDNPPAVLTAVYVVLNTAIRLAEEQAAPAHADE